MSATESRAIYPSLKGKRVFITGGGSGIGEALVEAFCVQGAQVAFVDIADQASRDLVERLCDAPHKPVYRQCDLTDIEALKATIAEIESRFGGIDVLVNNAAFQMTHPEIAEITDEEWQHTFDVNITAMFRLVQAALPHLGEGASIINTSSVNYDMPKPTLLPYATTKGAIANFTAGLAQMLGGQGIRVNAVAPGPIWTPLIPSTMPPEHVADFGKSTPLGRPGEPAEVAPVYVLLASDEASYISGAIIPVTGGKPIL